MKLQLITTLGDGRRYMKAWPMVKSLGFFFPEYRIVKATSLAVRFMPPLAVLAAASQIYLHGWDFLPQAIAIGLFFLSLPLQGLLWLGQRARHPLPLSLLSFGNQLQERLAAMGVTYVPLGAKACYLDMANLLKIAFECLDASYWDEL
ncbi:terminus macrodomain insulation protein YfbV [Shewanella sp.]|uniref:terminus macrodomain insulation protein YfbV n=1 Tax=Shewanella sp. TaxID=50422 RepID=UPI00356B4095